MNKFSKDTQAEIDLVIKTCKENGAFDAVLSENWEKGGEGARELGEAVVKASQSKSEFKFLYDLNAPIDEKIRTIAQKIYCAKDIELSELALKRIDLLKKQVSDIQFEIFTKKTPIISKNFLIKRVLINYQYVWQKRNILSQAILI